MELPMCKLALMAPELQLALQLGAVAALAGVMGSMLGIGGGIVLVPVFIGVLGIESPIARSASLAAACVTSLAASLVYIRQGDTDLGQVGLLQLPAVVGAIGGAAAGALLSPVEMQAMLAVIVLLVGVKMWRAKEKKVEPTNRDYAWAMIACLLGAAVSAMVGIGGGLFFVPILALIIGLPQRSAAATSTYLFGLTSATSALIYLREGQMDVAVALPTALGILIGAQFGARLSKRVPNPWLSKMFAVVKFATAALLVKEVIKAWVA